jgi:hypothetical protein
MSLRTVAEFAKVRGVRLAARDKERIRVWLKDGVGKLNDSSIPQNTASTRLSAAYDAVLSAALAVINAQGYRVDSSEGHHMIAIEILASSLGYSKLQHEELQVVRESRNQRYDGLPPNEHQVFEARAWAERVLKDVGQWFLDNQPQLLRS